MATFKPFKATDEFSMQTFNDKFEEVVADFNADNLKIDVALNQKGNCRMTKLLVIILSIILMKM